MQPSAWFLVLVIAVTISWDVASLTFGGEPATITGVVRDWAEQSPILVPGLTAAGFVLLWCHLFLGWF